MELTRIYNDRLELFYDFLEDNDIQLVVVDNGCAFKYCNKPRRIAKLIGCDKTGRADSEIEAIVSLLQKVSGKTIKLNDKKIKVPNFLKV